MINTKSRYFFPVSGDYILVWSNKLIVPLFHKKRRVVIKNQNNDSFSLAFSVFIASVRYQQLSIGVVAA